MGWTEGSGLGKNEDGMKNPIQVKRREEGTGLGQEPTTPSQKFKWNDTFWTDVYNSTAKKFESIKGEGHTLAEDDSSSSDSDSDNSKKSTGASSSNNSDEFTIVIKRAKKRLLKDPEPIKESSKKIKKDKKDKKDKKKKSKK